MGHKNTFAVSTFILPPAVSRLAYDEPCLKPGWRNRTLDIMSVNDYIIEMNGTGEEACYTRHVPQLHCYGLKKVIENESNEAIRRGDIYIGSINMYCRKAWREEEMDNRVHFEKSKLICLKVFNL